jgi:hypothetical protein
MYRDDEIALLNAHHNAERVPFSRYTADKSNTVWLGVWLNTVRIRKTQRNCVLGYSPLRHPFPRVPAVFNHTTGRAHQNCRKNLTSFR